ncbi:MAG TPA: transferrin receptor-like dimerization domain-containing protein [Thermoanaerobaculia bacterium]|nr:transferrin receptor-like dimerization domain-containing protein [Thermoanaerobaculia bacterium]
MKKIAIRPVARRLSGALLLAFAPLAAAAEGDATPTLVGFVPERVAAQLELEERFDATLDAEEMVEWNRLMTVAPHHAGSPQARANAERMLALFREWGFDAEIETYHVLFPVPRVRELTLLEPTRFEARLQEDVIAGDATSRLAVETGLPPFNAYSADGDVTAELVYVNQGVPADYEELERRGIDVAGKIVIARYGGSWRGIKPKVAAEHGAIGCLIYNDPRDDGYFQGETYPEGSFKHERGVQRGSVLDLPLRPGDPLTPMRGATEDAERLDRSDAETLMKIPVLPISWKDAQPLLAALAGPVAPPEWRGALPITYRFGPGPAKVRLRLELDWNLAPAHNVIARLAGAELPDQWVLRGNHHDAWVTGGRDPISGLIGLLAEAKAVGELAKTGWRPRRTLVYAAWDAEEPGLLGSTEWVEHHADELRAKATVYINSDSNGRGFLYVGGSHALERLVGEVAAAVTDPQTGVPVGERLRSALIVGGPPAEAERLLGGGALRISALGSGSDYSPFLQHLGVSSLNVGFGGESSGGEYHTAFDSHDFFRRFVDPGGAYGVALAQVAGRLSLRLAQADVLPFDFADTSRTIGGYLDEVMKMADDARAAAERHNRLVRERRFELAADPQDGLAPAKTRPEVPYFNWASLLEARDRLREAAASQSQALAARIRDGSAVPAAAAAAIDRALYQAERALIWEEGLPRRPWFRHHVYAPGFYTGYGVKTLPGVREAIEERSYPEAQTQIAVLAARLDALAAALEEAAALLDPSAAEADV